MTIKKIEDLKNIQIICQYPKQILECFEYLKQLGYEIKNYNNKEDYLIIQYSNKGNFFSNYNGVCCLPAIFYNKKLRKTLEKFIKEKEEKEKIKDFEVDNEGRILKINNSTSEKEIFICTSMCTTMKGDKIKELKPTWLEYVVKLGLVYATLEARDKAMFKLEIETKLKNIAERLNNGRKIDWTNDKYYICFDCYHNQLKIEKSSLDKIQGTIYCLYNNFLDVAKKEIGEDNLIKYFKEKE